GAVETLDAGAYVHDPVSHRLSRVDDHSLDTSLFDGVNTPVAESAALALFFVGHLPAIQPLYGDWARNACLIEAGAMTQLLAQAGIAAGIGGCTIGGYDEAAVRGRLRL